MLLGAVAVFYSLQLLPHHMTSLHNSVFGFFYPIAAALLGLVIVIGGVATFAVWMSTRGDESNQQLRSWCATFALMFGAAIALSLCSVAYARGLPIGSFSKRFDKQLWAASSASRSVSGDITERQKMLGDAIRTVVVNGTKENIIATLGTTDGYFSSSGRDLTYHTGPQRDSAFPIDDEWLSIWFDSDGRTIRYKIWSD
jgi:hypothetical protein